VPGKYEVVRKIAAGGMAEIFLARESRGGEGIVLKRMLPHLTEDEHFVKMFLDEAVIVGRLSHPAIVRLLDFGQDEEGRYFLALEWVRGTNLEALNRAARRQGRAIPFVLSARICADVAGALDYAHALKDEHNHPLGIVHRDISPANILVSHSGEVKLTDFGIAKARGNLARTQVGVLKGKYQYMSPEQAKSMPVDGRADVFALGSVIYKLTAGWQPFERDGEVATLRAVAYEDPPPPTALVAGYPPALEEVMFKALQKEPKDRFRTAGELKTALEGFLLDAEEASGREEIAKLVGELSEAEPLTGMAEAPWPSQASTAVDRKSPVFRKELERRTATLEKPSGLPTATPSRRRLELDEDRLLGLSGLEAPMLGRGAELASLCDLFRRAVADRKVRSVLVVGPAGIGKSRLAHEFRAFLEALATPATVTAARALPGAGTGPLAAALLQAAGQKGAPDEFRRRLLWSRFVSGLYQGEDATPDQAAEAAALAGELHGLDYSEDPDVKRFAGDPKLFRQTAVRALRSILERLAARAPLVLIVDDLHAGDPSLLDLLEDLAVPLAARFMLVALTRPELPAARPALLASGARLDLGPLGDSATKALVARLMGDDAPATLVGGIAGRAGGNPLLAEEIVRATTETRGEVPAGADLEGAMAGRFGRLPEAERRALARASVLGQAVSESAAEALCGDPEPLDALVSKGLLAARDVPLKAASPGGVVATEKEYRFVRAALREAAYASLGQAERASLHRAAAHHLASHGGDPMAVARHLERAGEKLQAAAAYGRAGDLHRARFAPRDALLAYARGADVAPDPAVKLDLALRAESVCLLLSDRSAQLEWIGRAASIADELHSAAAYSEIALRRASYFLAIRDLPAADREARAALTLKKSVGDRRGEGEALTVLGSVLTYRNRLDDALKANLNAFAIARSTGDKTLEARARVARGVCKVLMGKLTGAQKALSKAIAYCGAVGEVPRAALALTHLAETYHRVGDDDTALKVGSRALGLFRRIGHRWGEGLALLNLADYHRTRGPFGEAEGCAREAEKIHEAIAARMEFAFDACYLARVYLDRNGPGDLERALASADAGVERSHAAGNPTALVEGLTATATAFLRQGRTQDALEASQEAVRVLKEKRPLQEYEAEALYQASRVHFAAGRVEESRQLLGEAYARVQEAAAQLPDRRARDAFLAKVTSNRDIVHAWKSLAAA
jgi:serine/threonine protein kinase/tetratricopeptide (TPR) repeat protein